MFRKNTKEETKKVHQVGNGLNGLSMDFSPLSTCENRLFLRFLPVPRWDLRHFCVFYCVLGL